MTVRQLKDFILMIDEWLEEPHALSKDWVILLQYARQKISRGMGRKNEKKWWI